MLSVEHRLARGLHAVHAQVERGGALQAARELEQLGIVHALAQPLDHPVGKVGAQLEGQRVEVGGLERGEPRLVAVVQRALDLADPDALELHERGERHLARRRVRREVLEHASAPQRGEDRLGDQGAVPWPQVLVLAEEAAQLRIGGRARREDDGERVDDRLELSAGEVHGLRALTRVATCSTMKRLRATG
jgi:hypothetical protein